MNFNVIIVLTVINAVQNIESLAFGSTDLSTKIEVKKTCVRGRVYKLVGYDCSSMELEDVPSNLGSSVELLDLTSNRIRRLSKKSFPGYTNLKLLYLFHNMILFIEEGTFSGLTDLEAIDLSHNGLRMIPLELFELPVLRNIYYADNPIVDLEKDLKSLSKPVKAPIHKLDLSQCQLTKIPDFGILPDLFSLNISFNNLNDVSPAQLTQYCSLKEIYINETNMPTCPCKLMKIYLNNHAIKTEVGLNCESMGEGLSYCTDSRNSTQDSSEFFQCKEIVHSKLKLAETKRTWFSIIGYLFAFFVIFMGILYCLHRRNVKQMDIELKETKLKQIHQTENGNREVLLNKT